jgi:glycerol kinase
MPGFILSIDQGTTGSTVVLLSTEGEIVARATREFPQHFPQPGWVEHEPAEILASVAGSIGDALEASGLRAEDCLAIGITNQRETVVVWDRETGEPIHRAIVWQDRRTAPRCRELEAQGCLSEVRRRTGLVLDPYFSATKIEWILDAVPGARARAEQGKLAAGTIDAFLVHRLTGGAVHVTDATNASRTLLYELSSGDFDDSLADLFRVPRGILPEVRSSSEVYGKTKGFPGLPDGIPIAGMAGDQQAALFGQTCFDVGDAKCTYGTGAFLLTHVGTEPVHSAHGVLTTVAWRIGGVDHFALEGSTFVAGAAVQWLRDGLGIIESSADVEERANQVPHTDGVYFVPALTGLGAPHWDPDARGLICGITRGTTAAHLCRATLEGIAFQIADLGDAMAADARNKITRLRVDGGASANDTLMQMQADLLGVSVDRPSSIETTALGAAYLAGLAVGVFSSLDDVRRAYRVERTFEVKLSIEDREQRLSSWREAVRRARNQTVTR